MAGMFRHRDDDQHHRLCILRVALARTRWLLGVDQALGGTIVFEKSVEEFKCIAWTAG